MKYGYFDDSKKEYVITSHDTPLPWINYLGSDDFFALLSNTAGGYAFYKDARLRRLTRYRYNNLPLDNDGFHIYINDGESIWNPGFRPCSTVLDKYLCRHGIGYSIIEGERNNLRVKQTFYVPKNDPILLMKVTLSNLSSERKNFDLFSFVEFCLWDAHDDATNFQRNYSTGEVEVDGSNIYHKTEYRERRNHYAVFSTNRKITSFDTSRDSFMGVYGSAAAPQAVQAKICSNSIAHGWQPIGAHHLHLTLEANETQEIIFGLAYVEVPENQKFTGKNIFNKEPAEALIARYNSPQLFNEGLRTLQTFWDNLLSRFIVNSENNHINRMVNIWNAYQCMVTFNLSRSASYFESGIGRGMGFRDSCQDILGFVHMIPTRARERILDIAATQKEDGSAYHQYQPLTKQGNSNIGSGFNDDPLWLIAAVDAYLKETGDFSILDEKVAFDNQIELADTLLEHLRRSFQFTLQNLGPHKLPLIGRADWNDCLNLNCFSKEPGESFQTTGSSEGSTAESIFIAGMFVKYGQAYVDILKYLNTKDYQAEIQSSEQAIDNMRKAVLRDGFDGEWFLRAYDAFGEKVGSHVCNEGKIYIEPQGMCVMAGIGLESGEAEKALHSVEKYLETDYGIVLLSPSYSQYYLNLGEISSYPGGYKENGGIFCHNNPWVIFAETILGHGNRAFELYKKTCPSYLEDISDVHRTEPYVYCQMISGKDAPVIGEGKNSWLTGTAAWTFTVLTQGILGIKPDYDGLLVDPCIPETLTHYEITRMFRGTRYHITVKNPNHSQKGVKQIFVNGKEIPVGTIPHSPGENLEIEVIM